MTSVPPSQYDEYYYRNNLGLPYERNEHWLTFFGRVADAIVRQLGPATVLDVGCAMGFLVEALRDRGVDAWGIDVSEFAISSAAASIKDCVRVGAIGESLPAGFPNTFDIVLCIEVIEHLPGSELRQAIEWLTGLSSRVLFSSTPNDFAEASHLSVRATEEWSALFAEHHFFRNFDVDTSVLTEWSGLYELSTAEVPVVLRGYERSLSRARKEASVLRAEVLRLDQRLAATERDLQAAEAELQNIALNVDEIRAAARSEAEPGWRHKLEQAEAGSHKLEEAAIELRLELLRERDAAIGAAAEAEQARHRTQLAEAQLNDLRAQVAPLSAAARQLELTVASETWRIGRAVMAPMRLLRRHAHKHS